MWSKALLAVLTGAMVATALPSQATTGREENTVRALLQAASKCAGEVADDYERAAVLSRLAEVGHRVGVNLGPDVLSSAEAAANKCRDGYKRTLALCEVARVKAVVGLDPSTTLGEAELTAETIRVQAPGEWVVWDTVEAAAMAVLASAPYAEAAAKGMRLPAPPFYPPWYQPSGWWARKEGWVNLPPQQRAQTVCLWFFSSSANLYAAKRESWEAQQKHLRDLSRVRAATAWCPLDTARALAVAERVDDPAIRGDLLLSLAQIGASAGSAGAVDLCLRAIETARASGASGDQRAGALTRAVCALMIAAPEKAREPLGEVRGEIAQLQDPALRALLLGDLAVAARSSDPVLAAELFDEGVRALEGMKAGSLFTLFGLPVGGSDTASPNVQELLDRGYSLLVEGFSISPVRAADACEGVFRLAEPLASLGGATSSPMNVYPGESVADLAQWGVLRLLASHDLKRATALAERSPTRLVQAWGLSEIGVALANSDPQRAREFLDRAWEMGEEDLADLTKEVGLDSRGQFNIQRPRVGVAHDISGYIAESSKLYRQGARLLHIMGLQARIGVATRYAGGEQSLALQRCRRSLDAAKRVPGWAREAMYYHTGYVAGLITAAIWSLDAGEGARVAAEVRRLLDRNSRPLFALSACGHLVAADPLAALQFLAEAIENAPPSRTVSPALSPLSIAGGVLGVLRGGPAPALRVATAARTMKSLPRISIGAPSLSSFAGTARILNEMGVAVPSLPRDAGELEALALRIPSLAKKHQEWAGEVSSALAELALLCAGDGVGAASDRPAP